MMVSLSLNRFLPKRGLYRQGHDHSLQLQAGRIVCETNKHSRCRVTDRQTDRQTDSTLAAHARRG